jgi:hypothetical protein
LLCGKKIEKGIIYPSGQLYLEAWKAMDQHVHEVHGSVFDYLNAMDKKISGLSDHQSKLIGLFYAGKSDAVIQSEMAIGSASTIRNHRFALREKERQARVFLTLMDLLKEKSKHAIPANPPHDTATMIDDRYFITDEERQKILIRYFPEGTQGKLRTFSMKEKYRLVVLGEIAKRFELGLIYTERKLNAILKTVYETDYAVIRRYLIEYGFLDRTPDGRSYWIKTRNADPKKE